MLRADIPFVAFPGVGGEHRIKSQFGVHVSILQAGARSTWPWSPPASQSWNPLAIGFLLVCCDMHYVVLLPEGTFLLSAQAYTTFLSLKSLSSLLRGPEMGLSGLQMLHSKDYLGCSEYHSREELTCLLSDPCFGEEVV